MRGNGERFSRGDKRDVPSALEKTIVKTFSFLLVAAAAAFTAAVMTTAPARADVEFAWCGFLSISGGAQSCTFNTIDQCRAYVAGSGFCEPNPRAPAMAQMPKRGR